MILRNVSKYCRPLTSVCEAQSESDSERFAYRYMQSIHYQL